MTSTYMNNTGDMYNMGGSMLCSPLPCRCNPPCQCASSPPGACMHNAVVAPSGRPPCNPLIIFLLQEAASSTELVRTCRGRAGLQLGRAGWAVLRQRPRVSRRPRPPPTPPCTCPRRRSAPRRPARAWRPSGKILTLSRRPSRRATTPCTTRCDEAGAPPACCRWKEPKRACCASGLDC